MGNRIKSLLIGRPLKNEAIEGERFGVLWGLPILSSDAISSVAYAVQQMLGVLLAAQIGFQAYSSLGYLTLAIVALLGILVLSYRQTVDSYPNGGGAYIVAKDNLGVIAGVTAGAALTVGYILTVAVSIASGVDQLAAAFPVLQPWSVLLCVSFVLLIMVVNLRGVRESARIFGIPTYLFIAGMLLLIVVGAYQLLAGKVTNPPVIEPTAANLTQPLMIILLLRAFSNGCAAMTGVEAISNAVPTFREPPRVYAKRVLVWLGLIVLVIFGGISILSGGFQITVTPGHAVIVDLAERIFGRGFMYYYIMSTTFIILVMAANTAYSGFPLLVSVMAREGYAPRQMSTRGDRLSYSNGIILLSLAAIALLIAFRAQVDGLIGLYAIGVFLSFTLSQFGMFRRWIKHKGKHWGLKAAINGFGALVTTLVVVVIAIFKFREGAWIVVILIPLLVFLMLRVKRHYKAVAKQLKVEDEALADIHIAENHYRNRVVVPFSSINRASIRALRYARTISDNVTAFSVAIDEQGEEKLRKRWEELGCDIPLIVRYSPYRKVVEPLLEFIGSTEYDYRKNDMVTVILPQFIVKRWWNRLLHNSTTSYIERQLLKHKHIVVAVMPYQLKDDATAIGREHYID